MMQCADIIVQTQPPGAWIGRLACVSKDMNATLKPLFKQYLEFWKRVAICDRIYNSIGIQRNVNRSTHGIWFKETHIGHHAWKIVHRETITQGIFLTTTRVVIYPKNKSIMTLAVHWEKDNNGRWILQDRALKMKKYDDECEVPVLFEQMLEIYSWDWGCYHGPGFGDTMTMTEDHAMRAWFRRFELAH